MQYTAANIGKGIDANKAPNLPIKKLESNLPKCPSGGKIRDFQVLSGNKLGNKLLPKMEKKIMKPAEICITRRLPTRVDPRRPTFSLLEYTKVREREKYLNRCQTE